MHTTKAVRSNGLHFMRAICTSSSRCSRTALAACQNWSSVCRRWRFHLTLNARERLILATPAAQDVLAICQSAPQENLVAPDIKTCVCVPAQLSVLGKMPWEIIVSEK
jgi:hypothetical protein